MKKIKNLPVKGIDPEITLELVKEHGLSEEEYEPHFKNIGTCAHFYRIRYF